MIDWNIQSRSHVCQGCTQPFVDKQPYHTLLFDDRSAYTRLDVCEACWADRENRLPKTKASLVSQWQGVFTVPPPRPPDPIQKDTAESLLRKLVASHDAKYQAACFILAVMLERKRVFKVKAQEQADGHRVLVYEDPRSGDLFTIVDPGLHLDQLEQVQHDVMHLLQHGLPETEAPPPPAIPLTSPEGNLPPGEPAPAPANEPVPAVDTVPAAEAVPPASTPSEGEGTGSFPQPV